MESFFKDKEIALTCTAPMSLFVAVNDKMPNPLPDGFEDTNEIMSLIRISKPG